jgi:outer membrane protein assembly factor BamB
VISFSQPGLQRYYPTSAEANQHIGMRNYGPGVIGGKPGADGAQVVRSAPGAAGRGGARGRGGAAAASGEGDAPAADAPAGRAAGAGAPSAGGRGGEAGGRFLISTSPYPEGADVPPQQFTAYGMSPAMVKPPYSQITAYDLNTGTIKWQIPYGEAIGVDPPGNNFGIIKIHSPKARLGITAGGLAFSATIEKKVRAYDKDTGKVLWMTDIPAAAEGAPAIYEVDGREFVVFGVQGSYIAYALPQ